jgi:chemotaxis protein methyltransferase CheR
MNQNSAISILSDRNFNRVSQFIHQHVGIYLPAAKKTLLEGRLRKRMRTVQITSIEEYCDYIFSAKGVEEEIPYMVDAITTNKTDFFREPFHFTYLTETALPLLMKGQKNPFAQRYLAWSAACSTGEEPYTLAMFLSETGCKVSGFDFSIFATDISTRVLDKAHTAIYETEKIQPIPLEMRRKYLLRSRDPGRNVVRIVPELRQKVIFKQLNLVKERYPIPGDLHFIFCRNVLIYFDAETRERVIRQLCSHLVPGGYLFMGHSETINNLNVPLRMMAPTIYRKESKA